MNNPFEKIGRFFVFKSLAKESDFDQIAYIKLLSFAAKKAKGVGYISNEEIGFNLADIRKDNEFKSIREEWLKEILPDICTIRENNREIETDKLADHAHTKWEEYRFVIKSEEFIKYINLENAARAQRTWRIATMAIVLSAISLVGSILKEIFSNFCT